MKIGSLKHFTYPYHGLIGIGDRLKGKTIYKYMPIETALLCLQNNTLRFSVPTKWTDPFEKYFYTADYSNVMPSHKFDTKLYACCLTQNCDCEAAWRMYTDNDVKNPCIQFKIYPGQFRRFAEKFVQDKRASLYEGTVSYDLTDSEILHLYQKGNKNYPAFFADFSLEKYLNLMLLKRPFYRYEGEVRYLIHGDKLSFDDDYLDVKIPWSLCLYSVKLPPNCSDELKNKLEIALENNYNLCIKEYPGCYPQRIPPVENSLYAPLSPITIE